MFRLASPLVAVVLAFALAPRGADAADPAPLEAYGRLPSLENVQISPDGENLAFVATRGDQRQIRVERLADRKIIGSLNVGGQKLRGLEWAGPHDLLITLSQTASVVDIQASRREWFMVQDYDLSDHRAHALLQDEQQAMNVVAAEPIVRTVGGRSVAYLQGVSFHDRYGVLTLYAVDLATGRVQQEKLGLPETQAWTLDAQGQPLAETLYDDHAGRWWMRVRRGGAWVEARRETAPIDTSDVLGLGRDGRSTLIRVRDENGWRLHELSADGAWSPPIADEDDDGVIHDPVSHALIGVRAAGLDHDRYVFFDAHDQKVWDAVAKAYPGESVELVSWSDDRSRMVVRVDGPSSGAAYALVDLKAKHADWIGDVYADVPPSRVAEVKAIHYAAADGADIPAYLTLPKGRTAKNLPLVVLPHGGPAARDAPGFDWWAQALASRGYAVLQPEFRGSDGFGWAHLSAGFGQWGRKMQTDLSDGVRHLAAEGTIDPKRVCIVGASYGGYAALAGATLDPGVYRCAAALAGPADLRRFLAWERDKSGLSQTQTMRYWDRFMGAKSFSDPALDAISPALHADKVTIPVLLIHGQDDTVVPYDQSREMAEALRRADKPVELVTLKSEDHWLSRGATRLQMLQAVVAFLDKNNPPG